MELRPKDGPRVQQRDKQEGESKAKGERRLRTACCRSHHGAPALDQAPVLGSLGPSRSPPLPPPSPTTKKVRISIFAKAKFAE
jgi:hypothetical protein